MSPINPLCKVWNISILNHSGLYSFGNGMAATRSGSTAQGKGHLSCILSMFSGLKSCQFSNPGRSAWHKWQIPSPFEVSAVTCLPKCLDNPPTLARAGQSPLRQIGTKNRIFSPLATSMPVWKAFDNCTESWDINFFSGLFLSFFPEYALASMTLHKILLVIECPIMLHPNSSEELFLFLVPRPRNGCTWTTIIDFFFNVVPSSQWTMIGTQLPSRPLWKSLWKIGCFGCSSRHLFQKASYWTGPFPCRRMSSLSFLSKVWTMSWMDSTGCVSLRPTST